MGYSKKVGRAARGAYPRFKAHLSSTLVNNGVSLYEVQKLLGHAHIRTTERYAHLKQERLQESAGFAGKTFAHILNTPEPIVVPGGMALLKKGQPPCD